MPDTAEPKSAPITSKTGDKIVAGAMYVGTTGLITAAPAMGPQINPSGAGGIAVNMIGDGITTIVQALKMHSWFKQNVWAIWTCIVLAIIICGALYIVWLGNPEQGVLNALGSMAKAATNYGPLNKLGVLAAAPDVPPPQPTGVEGEPKA